MLVVALLAGIVALPVLAQEEAAQTTESPRERKQGRLEEAKLKTCEARIQAMSNLATRAGERGQKNLNLFTNIFTRVETFAGEKRLSVEGYDDAKNKVLAAKTTAQAAVDAVKDGFQVVCGSDNPIGQVDEFKEKLKTMHSALKDYRTTIKDFLTTVKQAAKKVEQ